jgi:hypothetical protein
MAVLDKEGMGPRFGPDGLKIPLQASGGKERTAQVLVTCGAGNMRWPLACANEDQINVPEAQAILTGVGDAPAQQSGGCSL